MNYNFKSSIYLRLCCLLLFYPMLLRGQSSNHWSRNFNEESSLISGAVVGGGAGASSIYYNPAGISEIEQSKLSVNASLFSIDVLNAKNAWGNDIDFFDNRFFIVPRFISFMLKPQNNSNWSLEFAFMNNENYEIEDVGSVDKQLDILHQNDGVERYNAFYKYDNKYRDDWLGTGGSYKINPELFLGVSMFGSIRSLSYSYMVDIEAGPVVQEPGSIIENFYTAKFKEEEFVKFNSYRLLWKLGLIYKTDNVSLGLNISTPSLGIYSDGKRVARKTSQSNITTDEGESVPDFLLAGYAEKKEVYAGFKSPLSVAVGATFTMHNNKKVLYTTLEYFAGIDPYRLVKSKEEYTISGANKALENSFYDELLTYVWGAKPILNAALGYRWSKNNITTFLGGFRTDFNYRNGLDYQPLVEKKTIKGFLLNKYHLTGGVTTKFRGQDLMTGIQYTLGVEKNKQQFANLSDPVEYNPGQGYALQGIRQNNMQIVFHSIGLYFGATFNFKNRDEK